MAWLPCERIDKGRTVTLNSVPSTVSRSESEQGMRCGTQVPIPQLPPQL